MNKFYGVGHSMPKISPHVETQCFASPIQKRRHEWTSLRKKRLKHTSAVQRGEIGIPRSVQAHLQMFLYATRRGVLNTPTSHASKYGRKHSAPTVLLLCFLCLFNHALAQPRQDIGAADGQKQPKPLAIGQKVPEEFWTHEHLFYVNGDTVRKTLGEHRGKILVLDFWMSGCMPCLLHQREINHFKATYPEGLAVVMVNSRKAREDFQKVDRFARSERYTGLGIGELVSVIGDTYLESMFPYSSYPSYFWINESGILQTHTFRNLLDRNYQAPFTKEKP